MARFHKDQKVVCIRPNAPYRSRVSGKSYGMMGPKFNEIVTVSGYSIHYPDSIFLVEHSTVPEGFKLPNCYLEKYFEPLADITEIHEILQSEDIEV